MIRPERVVIFTIDEQRYAVPLLAVERIVRMVEITPIPGAPPFVRGVITCHGEIMPVLDLRRRLGLPERPVELGDQLIITRCAKRCLVLMVDSVCGVWECPEQMFTACAEILPDLPFLSGVAKLPQGLILLQDPAALLFPHEAGALDMLMTRGHP